MRPIFPYVGSKMNILNEILTRLPEHKVYVEPFVGGGSVYWNKPSVDVNIISDINKDLIDAYLALANFSLEELEQEYCSGLENQQNYINNYIKADLSPKDFMFFLIKSSCTFMCKSTCRKLYRPVSRNKFDKLKQWKDKIDNTIIFNKDVFEMIEIYDSPDTLFFLDPPYVNSGKSNYYSSNNFNYQQLSDKLKLIHGKFILTINDDEKIREIFSDFCIDSIVVKSNHSGISNRVKNEKKFRNELIITNFNN